MLDRESSFERAVAESAQSFVDAWSGSLRLTPRQARAITHELDLWADLYIGEWLRDSSEPLHEVAPFGDFDIRIMMLVDENRSWTEAARQRRLVISDEIAAGTLPFDRPGPLIDEVLIGAALNDAQALLTDMPNLFDLIPPRNAVNIDDDDYLLADEDWDLVSDGFDNECHWDECEVPIMKNHRLLPAILVERHPYRWFDFVQPSGAGYLQKLLGIIVDD